MTEVLLSPEEEALKYKALELGWNNKISIDKDSRRALTMTEDIRDFMNASITPKMGGSLSPGGFGGTFGATKKGGKTKDAFDTIASTFGFVHHTGTDQNLELKMIKSIVARESQLMKLMHLCAQKEGTNPDGQSEVKPLAGTKILTLMISLRDTTLDFLETLQEWRLTASAMHTGAVEEQPLNNELNPRVFVWEGYNYTMKVVSDLDFLSESIALADALGIPPEKLRANPLMLPTTLEETADSWMEPALRAAYDCQNQTTGSLYEERLRLRNAERLLLLEIECNTVLSTEDMLDGREMGKDGSVNGNDGNGQNQNNNQQQQNVDINGIMQWEKNARRQAESLDPAKTNYKNAVIAHQGKVPQVSNAPQSKKGKQQQQQKKSGGWDAQAEIFPESEGLDSGAAFYASFDQFAEDDQMMSAQEMHQYDSYLTGSNVLEMDQETSEQHHYANQFGFQQQGSNRGNQALQHQQQHYGFAQSEEDLGSTGLSATSSLTIDNINALDLERIVGLQKVPTNVMLAGAACVILLAPGDEVPSNLTWDEFIKLVAAENPAARMNAIEPQLLPKFRIRSIRPYLEQLKFSETNANSGVPHDMLECVERLFRWIQQVVQAADGSKRRKRTQKGEQPHLLNAITVEDGRHELLVEDSKMKLMGGKPLKDDQGRQVTKAQSQRQRADQMMRGKTVGKLTHKKPTSVIEDGAGAGAGKVNKLSVKPSELWPVHTEILETIYKHPLLLTVLSSQQEIASSNTATAKKLKKDMLQYDPLEIAGNGMDPPPEKIVVKVYNLVDSQETAININVRDFTLFLYDLIEKKV